MSLSPHSTAPAQATPANTQEAIWLCAKAEEIVSVNPGGPFPERDQEFGERTLHFIQQTARAQMRGKSFADFNEDDLADESLMRIIRFFPGFHGKNFARWIYRIIRHTFWSMLEKDGRTPATSIEAMAALPSNEGLSAEELFPNPTDVVEDLEAREIRDGFLAWLDRRNPRHARIVTLYFAGLTDEEIAQREGVAYRTVCSVLQRAPRSYAKSLNRVQPRTLARRGESDR